MGTIKTTNDQNYWIYILNMAQWEVIVNKRTAKKTYIPSYYNHNIKKNDIIIFYVKYIKKNDADYGIKAVGQAKKAMVNNTSNKIIIFEDKNINRYALKLKTMIICEHAMHMSSLSGVFLEYSDINYRSFSSKYLKGECTFSCIDDATLGKAMTDYILDHHGDIENKKEEEEEEKTIYEKSKSMSLMSVDNGYARGENVNRYKYQDDVIVDSSIIVTNVPILMLSCKKLLKNLNKLEQNAKKIEAILMHYKYCTSCEITNNSDRELQSTLNIVENIEYVEDGYDYESCLDAYIDCMVYTSIDIYEEEGDSEEDYETVIDKNYIKIYRMMEDPKYTNDILFEFTSNIRKIKKVVDD